MNLHDFFKLKSSAKNDKGQSKKPLGIVSDVEMENKGEIRSPSESKIQADCVDS